MLFSTYYWSLIQHKNKKQPDLGTADDRVARDDCSRHIEFGVISLTIQGKCDLKALSSEKIMINKCIDYSHVIREQVRKISFGLETIDD